MLLKKLILIISVLIMTVMILFMTAAQIKLERPVNKDTPLPYSKTIIYKNIYNSDLKMSYYTRSTIKDIGHGFIYQEIDLKDIDKDGLMVVLTLGQSHSANFGDHKYKCKEKVYFFYDGKFYLAKDPLLGADGDKGSVWTRLGDKIVAHDLFGTVLFIPIGSGGSTIDMWRPGTCLHKRILKSLKGIDEYGLEITHVFWHQGSSDSWDHSIDKALKYEQSFLEIVSSLRSYGIKAPVFICQSTYSYGNSDHFIREVQKDLANNHEMIFEGPDSDSIACRYRYDGVHFSKEGLEILSDLWLEKIIEYTDQ